MTALANSLTSLCILVDAAAAPPSTARNAFVIAIAIFSASYDIYWVWLEIALLVLGVINP